MPDAPKFNVEFGKAAPPPGGRLDAAAFHRNHAAIAGVLVPFLQDHTGHLLEIGSGTGQHAVDMARQMPTVTWWPTDFNDSHLRSIAAWRDHEKLENLKEPVRLDASAADWQLKERGLPEWFTVMFCANVIHIAPWAVAEGLFAGASRHLRAGGQLWLYGPFRRDGEHNAPSNAAFDQSLRRQNPEWGVRDTGELRDLALRNNLTVKHTYELPSNNAILTFEQS
jgi:cyclopropane fatty-acyl-phospholipid synthase-like methyltransferase